MGTGIYTLTTEKFEEQCNTVKDVLLRTLFNEGLISIEIHNDFVKNYSFIIRKPSFFSHFWKTFFNHDRETYILVKQQSFRDEGEPDEDDNRAKLKVVDFNNDKKED